MTKIEEDVVPENQDPLQRDFRLHRCTTFGKYSPQSGEVSQVITEAPDESAHQITSFADQEAGWMKDASGTFDSTYEAVETADSQLGAFLGRPLVVDSTAWVVGQPLYYQINPWELFLTQPSIARKLANYELLRCNLNVKVVISGTGFHYGRTLVSYNPLNGYDEASTTRNFIDQDLVAASQRPCIFLNPTDNSGGDMKIPFFFLKNYMSLSKGDYSDMGVLDFKSFGNLLHANGGDDPVYITTYVWASEWSLTMPTSINPSGPTRMIPQAGGRPNPKKQNHGSKKATGNSKGRQKLNQGDEYGKGIISGPASAVAKAAGMLTSVPFIEPYARATEMVASKLGAVASIFGYSRPAVISDFLLQKPSPTGNLANMDASDAVNRLTMDSKQELTIDSRTVGLDGGDQMTLDSIQTRESYLTSFTMSSSDLPDAILWNSYVTPNLFAINQSELHMTPMAMLSQYFSAWQGSIKFRFQVVKSNFHKGRLLVRYDPRSHSATVDNATNYTRVIDLAEEDDFEIEIGWGQNEPFLGAEQANASRVYYGGARLPTDSNNNHNGVIEVNVLNSLVSPSVDSDIRINVFVSAGDDMKWGRPDPDKLRNLHYFPQTSATQEFTPQSGEATDLSGTTGDSATDRPTEADPIDKIGCDVDDDHMMEVFYGEMPVSLRELFRRYVFTRTNVTDPGNPGEIVVENLRLKSLPFHSGDDPQGLDAKADGTRYNAVQTSPVAFFMPCYAGWRGSLRHKWIFSGNTNPGGAPVVQNYGFLSSNGAQTQTTTFSNVLELTKFLSFQRGRFTNAGAAATNLGVNNTIETEIPFYQNNRFATSRILTADSLPCNSYQITTTEYNIDDDSVNNVYDRWDSVGEDFTLFFWSGVPIMYNYSRDQNS